jgi:nucleoid-associated protein YgaU
MSRDVKTGMFIGLVLVIIGLIVISMWPGGSVEDRLLKDRDERTVQPVLGANGGDSTEGAESIIDDNDSSEAPVEPIEERSEGFQAVREDVVEEVVDPPVDTTPRIHIVAANETLSSIAQLHYGDANKWSLIAEANKDVIKNVDRLTLGMRLAIPKP